MKSFQTFMKRNEFNLKITDLNKQNKQYKAKIKWGEEKKYDYKEYKKKKIANSKIFLYSIFFLSQLKKKIKQIKYTL